jgi:Nif-specific regulatory protein
VRIIAATNKDLDEEVREKRFRSDLLFRLQVMKIRTPSLSERRDDIAALAAHFCDKAVRLHELARVELSPGAISAIEAAEWPGGVRQLAGAMEVAAARAAASGASVIEVAHVFPAQKAPGSAGSALLTFQEETRRFQSSLLSRALTANDWNVTATARALDLTRAHVYNLINAFGLKREGGS